MLASAGCGWRTQRIVEAARKWYSGRSRIPGGTKMSSRDPCSRRREAVAKFAKRQNAQALAALSATILREQ